MYEQSRSHSIYVGKKSFNKTELAVAGFYAHYIPFLFDDKRQGNKHTIPSFS